MVEFSGATFLLMWATGGLFFGWVTGRHREVGIGYGWTLRLSYLVIVVLALIVGRRGDTVVVRELASTGVILAIAVAMAVSWSRRRAGVAGQREQSQRRSERVTEMTGIDREQQRFDSDRPEFPPSLDLIAPLIGLVGIMAGAVAAEGSLGLSVARTLVGALFLGVVSDSMLLGHWYLVQPGMPRAPLIELVWFSGLLWLPELIVFLIPTGMVSVLNGTIDDGYQGLLGWFWAACVVTTITLVVVTRAALRERQYAAVMAATGLMYLAILTGFGMDLVARVLLDT